MEKHKIYKIGIYKPRITIEDVIYSLWSDEYLNREPEWMTEKLKLILDFAFLKSLRQLKMNFLLTEKEKLIVLKNLLIKYLEVSKIFLNSRNYKACKKAICNFLNFLENNLDFFVEPYLKYICY